MKIEILPKAEKSLKTIPDHIRKKICAQIDQLAENPLPKNSKKLTGQPGYRIRIGDWRVLYIFNKQKKLIIIARIAHRREIYR